MCDEGVIKFELEHRIAKLPASALGPAPDILAWRAVMIGLGAIGRDPSRYGGAGFGNISGRLPPYPGERGERRFAITGSQTSDNDPDRDVPLVVIERYSAKRNYVRSVGPIDPSSESMTHGTLYDLSPSIRFVLHGHVPAIWSRRAALRIPTTAEDVDYGTPEMASEAARLYRESSLSETKILAMAGHQDGVMTFGRTAEEAGEVLVRYLSRAYRLVR